MADEIVVISPKDINESKALSKDLANSALMPQVLRKKPEDVLAIVLTGAELGLAPMQAIRGIHIINGKASLSADLMGALVKRSAVCEYLQLTESTGERATYKTKRKGDPEATTLTFTLAQAKAAGVTGNPTWAKYPDAMLRARCLAAICRAVYPDLCLGLYDADSGEIVESSAVQDEPVTLQHAHVEKVKAELKTAITDAEFTPVAPVASPTMAERIKDAKTAAELAVLVPELGKLPEQERQALRGLYMDRKAELS
jgi:hypothetical protein